MSEATRIAPGHEPDRHEFRADEVLLNGIGRRDFLRRLGGGLLVVCLLRPGRGKGAAQEAPDSKRAHFEPDVAAAWLHIAPDGAVTVYTGKVEIGQNARTSLTQAVAEELRAEPGSIGLVMGDTDLCPHDIGTFGSLTTPVMFLQLRKAAATARGWLIERAAQAGGVEAGTLEAQGGRIAERGTDRTWAYGELAGGQEVVKTIAGDTALIAPAEWTIAGTSLPKIGGEAFVTGRHRYGSDLRRPGMKHGKVLRPPSFGAVLEGLDTAAAAAMSGVMVVHEGDFAGVVADDEATAERALAALVPAWKESPAPVSDRELFDHLRARARPGGGRDRQEAGDVARALEGAEVRVEGTYTAAHIAHVPLEPRACVAEWQGETLTVWTGTQVPFGVRAGLAQALGLPQESVRVIVSDTGSGYGGKHTPESEIEAARLARAAGCAVRRGWSRTEEFTWGYARPAAVIDVKAGAARDGTLRAWEFHNINAGTAGLGTPYEVADRLVEHQPSDSPIRQGSYRALAATVNHFARESMMDELAAAVGMDRLAFRLKNVGNPRLRDALMAATERFSWAGYAKAEGRGIGLACAADKGACVATCVEVEVEGESRRLKVLRLVTAFEPGAIVNPDQMRSQVEGATVMGLGGALFEAVKFRDGRLSTASLTRYRVPRFRDLPAIEVVLLDRRDIAPAGGGEIPIVTVAPAIAGAIHDATGVRLRSLPLVPNGRVPRP